MTPRASLPGVQRQNTPSSPCKNCLCFGGVWVLIINPCFPVFSGKAGGSKGQTHQCEHRVFMFTQEVLRYIPAAPVCSQTELFSHPNPSPSSARLGPGSEAPPAPPAQSRASPGAGQGIPGTELRQPRPPAGSRIVPGRGWGWIVSQWDYPGKGQRLWENPPVSCPPPRPSPVAAQRRRPGHNGVKMLRETVVAARFF